MVYEQFIDGDVAILEFLREEEADAPKEQKAKRAIAELFADDRIWTRRELFVIAKSMGFGQKVTIAALAKLENEDGLVKSWRAGVGGAYHYQRADMAFEQRELSNT